MRIWRKPQWVIDQETDLKTRGYAMVRNHAGAGNGTTWLKLTWQKYFGIENQEQRDNKFRLRDEKTRQEYILDKEELMTWLRNV